MGRSIFIPAVLFHWSICFATLYSAWSFSDLPGTLVTGYKPVQREFTHCQNLSLRSGEWGLFPVYSYTGVRELQLTCGRWCKLSDSRLACTLALSSEDVKICICVNLNATDKGHCQVSGFLFSPGFGLWLFFTLLKTYWCIKKTCDFFFLSLLFILPFSWFSATGFHRTVGNRGWASDFMAWLLEFVSSEGLIAFYVSFCSHFLR